MSSDFSKHGIFQTDYLVGPPTGERMEIAPFHTPRATIDNLTVNVWTGETPANGSESSTIPPVGQLFTVDCDINTTIWDMESPRWTNKTMTVEFFKQGQTVVGKIPGYFQYVGLTSQPSWSGIIEPTGIYTVSLVPQSTIPSALWPAGVNASTKITTIHTSNYAYVMGDKRCPGDVALYNNGNVSNPVLYIRIRMYYPDLSSLAGPVLLDPICFSYPAAS